MSVLAVEVLVAAVVLVAVAVMWRTHWRWRARRVVVEALTSPDPRRRQAGVLMASHEGLAPYVEPMAGLVAVETDPDVIEALVQAVRCNQWLPATHPSLVMLRLWAAGREVDNQAKVTVAVSAPADEVATNVTRPVASGGGEVATPTAGVATPVEAPADPRDRGHLLVVDLTTDQALADADPARSRLALAAPPAIRGLPGAAGGEVLNVLVTGAGGPAGVGVIQALLGAGHRVVAADADPQSAGLALTEQSGVLPMASHRDFIRAVCDLGRRTGAEILVSTVAEEIVVLAAAPYYLKRDGNLDVWIPRPQVVARCIDKWEMALIAVREGLSFPPTNLGSATGVPGPWVVKPRLGRGSRDVHIVHDEERLAWAIEQVPGAIVQSLLPGQEFTVDVLAGRDYSILGAVPRWRLQTKAGISTKGRTFVNTRLVEEVARVSRVLGLEGPFNIQGFLDPDGRLGFTDLNPRFSGGLALSLAAGADLVGQYLRGIRGLPVDKQRLRYREGVQMTRFFREVFQG
jgi:carbamoyl-phosphate synthase large subunit